MAMLDVTEINEQIDFTQSPTPPEYKKRNILLMSAGIQASIRMVSNICRVGVLPERA